MSTTDLPVIETERLTLKIPGAAAAPHVIAYNRENQAHLAPWDPPMTERSLDPAVAAESLEQAIELARNGTEYHFLIFFRDQGLDGPLIGKLNFTVLVRGVWQNCNMGYSLGNAFVGCGYMTEACCAAIDFMFRTVGLHRIAAAYMPHNHRSAAVLKRLGFQVDGVARNYLYLGGAWQDHILTSLLNPNPRPPS
ncbi:MAG: GNAT family N-acetyltransferase [Vulcanimicrobiaceae bacterium]